MESGEQILLIRKGGIREEGGVFSIVEREFFLLPTYEHQNPRLLKPEFGGRFEALQAETRNPNEIVISSYAEVTHILEAKGEEQVNAAAAKESIWNATYVRERFDFNPYDPLYLVLLRVFRLSEALRLPLAPQYGGCKSWVTLERVLSMHGATPAVEEREFQGRVERVLQGLE
jgi:hypothetical protein